MRHCGSRLCLRCPRVRDSHRSRLLDYAYHVEKKKKRMSKKEKSRMKKMTKKEQKNVTIEDIRENKKDIRALSMPEQ